MKILVVEDEVSLQKLIKYDLDSIGYDSCVVSDGHEAITLFKEQDFDVILLDLMLPNKNGIEICHEIRAISSDPYIIMITAIDDEISKLDAFNAGADDYVVKPFSMREVIARIEAGKRRIKKDSQVLAYKHVKIDLTRYIVNIYEREIELTHKEFLLTVCFLKNINVVLSRDMLLDNVWGYDYDGETRVVDIYVHKIREKLEFGDKLKTIRGIGYVLRD